MFYLRHYYLTDEDDGKKRLNRMREDKRKQISDARDPVTQLASLRVRKHPMKEEMRTRERS